MIQPGTYKLKVNDNGDIVDKYIRVILNCEHSETHEHMVLYVKMDGDGTLRAMPTKLFRERAVPTSGGNLT